MLIKAGVALLFFATFCCCEVYLEEQDRNVKTVTTTGLEILSDGPCGLIPDWALIGLSEQCHNDFTRYREAICNVTFSNFENLWALKMLDATGKVPDGILEGNFNALGSYSECIEIEAVIEGKGEDGKDHTFSGKYGAVNQFYVFPNMLYGVCLPSTCSDDDFWQIVCALDRAVYNVSINEAWYYGCTNKVLWIPNMSVANETYKLEGGDIIMILFLAFLGGLLVAATLLESWMIHKKAEKPAERWKQFLLGFSIYSNTIKLFKIVRPSKAPGGSEHLSCLDGMRFISMTLVLLAHTYTAVGAEIPSMNFLPSYIGNLNRFLFQAVDNGFICVDSFFFMSGTLLAYLTFKELDKRKGRLNVPLFYLHRYLRLTGVYAFILCLHYTLIGVFKNSPQIKAQGPGANIENTREICQRLWWKNLLYVGIYTFGMDEAEYPRIGCVGQAWYLDNDMQMFLIILLPIFLLWKYGRSPPYAGIIAAGGAIVASIAVPFALHIIHKWPATTLLPVPPGGDDDYFTANYLMPWCRFSPYIGGVVMGYILYRTKDKEIKIPRELNLLLWSVSFIIGLSVVYGLNIPAHQPGDSNVVTIDDVTNHPKEKDLSLAASAVYGGFHRFAWAVAIGWVVFACCRGYGGWINEFLSWEAFQPLSRLTYIIYLVHITINQIVHSYATFVMVSSNFLAVIYICSTLVFSIAASIIIYIGFELPWLSTEKLLISMLTGGTPNPKKATS